MSQSATININGTAIGILYNHDPGLITQDNFDPETVEILNYNLPAAVLDDFRTVRDFEDRCKEELFKTL